MVQKLETAWMLVLDENTGDMARQAHPAHHTHLIPILVLYASALPQKLALNGCPPRVRLVDVHLQINYAALHVEAIVAVLQGGNRSAVRFLHTDHNCDCSALLVQRHPGVIYNHCTTIWFRAYVNTIYVL